jgi:hypothetical protein
MVTAEARIATDRPDRYLVQLCQHAGNMRGPRAHWPAGHRDGDSEVRHAEWTDSYGIIRTSSGECTLRPAPGALTVRVEAVDEDNLLRLQDLIARRLERFGRRDRLTVTWQRPGETGQPA